MVFPISKKNHSGDTSTLSWKTMRKWTVRIESFIFCCCRPLNSQNEAQEVSEKLKNCRWEHQKCVSRDLSAAATVIDPLKLLLALTGTQNLGGIPPTHQHLQKLPGPHECKYWGRRKLNRPVRRLDRYGQNLFSGWSPKNLQFYVLNYENVTCHLTGISRGMTHS